VRSNPIVAMQQSVRMTARPRLTRSQDRLIAGVCGGIADFLGWSHAAVRAIFVLISVASAAFPGILIYVVLWWVMPPPDASRFNLDDYRVQ
jgi:phage shock protein C